MRKILSFLTAILFAGSMMADSFAPKALADISADDVVIVTMTNANGTYALANDKSTSAAPVAVAVTVTDGKISTDVTNILWKITKDGNNLSITAGENQLYCTNTNNGVRVGTTTGTFIIKDDYLCCTSTSSNRYLGVYNNQDWRCYTTINSNITGQTLAFYVKEGAAPAVKYYMKNNWDAAADWTWKEMTKDGDNYKLESVVFGGTGVNYNTAADDNGATWVPVADIAGDKLAAKDTVNLVLNPTAGTVTAAIVGKYTEEVATTKYYMKNNWDAATDWTWKEMTKDGDNYKLTSVVFGGTGVNYNTAADDNGSTWVPVANIAGDKLAAKDTVNLVLNPTAGTVTAAIVGKYTEEVATTKYYMKNNWDAATDWTWKEMTKDGDNYKLTSVVFGGTGVNYNTATSDDGATWVPVADIAGDKLAAKDTVNLVLNPTAGTVTAAIVGKYAEPVTPPTPAEHTYTVAGGSDVLFGTTWAPANTANDMVKQEDGTYKWEKTELTLPAGAIEFKVCEDHAWTTAYPAQNYQLNIAEAGIYTITITFNPAAEENKVAAVATKTGSAVVDPTVAVKGSWDGWANELKFTLADNKETATLTVENIKAGTYEFKVILNGSDWRSNAQEFTRENASATGISGNNDANMKIVADVDGTYSFTWTFATNALNITFPKTGTGIDNTADGIKAVKVIRDGQLLIIKGEKTFTIQGQLVK